MKLPSAFGTGELSTSPRFQVAVPLASVPFVALSFHTLGCVVPPAPRLVTQTTLLMKSG